MIDLNVNEDLTKIVVGGKAFETTLCDLNDEWDIVIDGLPVKLKGEMSKKFVSGLFRRAAIAGVGYISTADHKTRDVPIAFNQERLPIDIRPDGEYVVN